MRTIKCPHQQNKKNNKAITCKFLLPMKKIILLFTLIIVAKLSNAQDTKATAYPFRQFIKDNELKINDYPDDCLRFFGVRPESSEFESKKYEVFVIRDNYVGILFTTEVFDFTNEVTANLTTYDWNGNKISEMKFEYGITGDLQMYHRKCEFLSDYNIIQCAINETEGGMEQSYNEDGEITGTTYVSMKKETIYEKYEIQNNGEIIQVE